MISLPCRRYYYALENGNVLEGHCPLMKGQLCLHPHVEGFPWSECQMYLMFGEEKSEQVLKSELEDLKQKRVLVWGD